MSELTHCFGPARALPHARADRRFEKTFTHAPVGMAQVGPDGRFLRVNDQFCLIAGHTRDALLEHGFQHITHPDDLHSDLAHVQALLDGRGDRYAMEKRYIRGDGGTVWIKLIVSIVRDAAGVPDFFVAVIEDLSEIKRAQADALLDPLTGLLNRRGLIDRLSRAIAHVAATRLPLGIVYLDLDDFKTINDSFGHDAGDACLLAVARALHAAAPGASATASRIGGDEFVLLLPDTDAAGLAEAIARLQAALVQAGDTRFRQVQASFGGVCFSSSDAITPQELIAHADHAMLQAKRAGKGRSHLVAV